MITLPHPPVELAWDETNELAGLPGDACRQTARAGSDQLAARLLRAAGSLIVRRLSAQAGAGQ